MAASANTDDIGRERKAERKCFSVFSSKRTKILRSSTSPGTTTITRPVKSADAVSTFRTAAGGDGGHNEVNTAWYISSLGGSVP